MPVENKYVYDTVVSNKKGYLSERLALYYKHCLSEVLLNVCCCYCVRALWYEF